MPCCQRMPVGRCSHVTDHVLTRCCDGQDDANAFADFTLEDAGGGGGPPKQKEAPKAEPKKGAAPPPKQPSKQDKTAPKPPAPSKPSPGRHTSAALC